MSRKGNSIAAEPVVNACVAELSTMDINQFAIGILKQHARALQAFSAHEYLPKDSLFQALELLERRAKEFYAFAFAQLKKDAPFRPEECHKFAVSVQILLCELELTFPECLSFQEWNIEILEQVRNLSETSKAEAVNASLQRVLEGEKSEWWNADKHGDILVVLKPLRDGFPLKLVSSICAKAGTVLLTDIEENLALTDGALPDSQALLEKIDSETFKMIIQVGADSKLTKTCADLRAVLCLASNAKSMAVHDHALSSGSSVDAESIVDAIRGLQRTVHAVKSVSNPAACWQPVLDVALATATGYVSQIATVRATAAKAQTTAAYAVVTLLSEGGSDPKTCFAGLPKNTTLKKLNEHAAANIGKIDLADFTAAAADLDKCIFAYEEILAEYGMEPDKDFITKHKEVYVAALVTQSVLEVLKLVNGTKDVEALAKDMKLAMTRIRGFLPDGSSEKDVMPENLLALCGKAMAKKKIT
jgi:hypothetical protein